ncbi:MAG: substrate-binding domain-containing protein [Kiritimatiellia bacterium]
MGGRRKVIIGLRLEGTIGRRILSGVLQYLDSAGDWDIQFAYGAKELRRLAPSADGILADHLMDEAGFDRSELAQIPVVHFNTKVPSGGNPRHAYVHADNGAIGFAAAEYLTGLGSFRSYGFIPAHHGKSWSEARERAFALRLGKDGHDCRIYARSPDDVREDIDCLADWIRALPKPAALFAAWDGRAIEVLDACRRANVRIPQQAVLLGVDNDEISCDRANPPLSSIEPDTERDGFEGARILDRLMRLKGGPKRRIVLGKVKRIVERTSTKPPAPASHLVRRALDYIRENATHGIAPDDVAGRLGVSRSLLDLRFRELEGRTVGECILAGRLAALAAQLRRTRRSIADLTRTCGFANANSAKATFRRRYGMTMSAYRRAHTHRTDG